MSARVSLSVLLGITALMHVLSLTGVSAQTIDTSSSQLALQMDQLHREMARLEREVMDKNDLTELLERRVKELNASLAAEKIRTTDLERRVTVLELRQANMTMRMFGLEVNQNQTNALANSLQSELIGVHQMLGTTAHNIDQLTNSWTSEKASIYSDFDRLAHTVNRTILQQVGQLQTSMMSKLDQNKTYFAYRNLDYYGGNNSSKPLIFNGEIASSGSNYDPNTGEFTASEPGIYWFSATISAHAQDYIRCYIMRNGNDHLVEIYASNLSDNTSASSSVAVDLSAGDKVYVGSCDGNGQIDTYKSSFSGFKVD